jgi:peptidyl-prolyl cis-trans isomerase D
MSVIQKIRDKYARVAVIAIALSLLGFILMDALSGRSNLFGGFSDTVGSVNGKKIKYQDFNLAYDRAEKYARQQGYDVSDESRQQIMQQVWTEQVNEKVMEDEYEALGLSVSDKELDDMLFGDNPPQDLRQAFSDSLGRYDVTAAQNYFNELKKNNPNPEIMERRAQMNEYLLALKKQRIDAKYNALFTNTVYIPKWFVEKRNADNSLVANISYVAVPYTSISDSSVKVTDDEIKDYISKHKKEFKQENASRSISYVLFPIAPSSKDSAEIRDNLLSLKAGLDSTTNYEDFITRNNSRTPFLDAYINKNDIQQPNKDSILGAPVGVTYGPYLDANAYALSKIIGVRQQPDTVKVRHILVATQTQNPQTGQPMAIRDEATAKHLMDSIVALHKAGTSFDTLVAKFSDDPGSKDKGGVYEDITSGKMVPSFNDFIFGNKTGSTGVVKTDFGYHYIEVLSQKGSSTAYKIAYLAKEIPTSQATEESVFSKARMFRAGADDYNTFNSHYEKTLKNSGINKLSATDIGPLDYAITGVGGSRAFIKSIYDADKGDVLGPEKVGNAYVVAIVTDVEKAGTQGVARARMRVEPILRNKKKAEMIKKNMGPITTLEAVSAKVKQPVQVADSIRMGGSANPISFESRVVGASFNPDNKGKVVPEPLEGQSGVYAIKVNNVGTVPVQNANIEEIRKQMEMQARQTMMYQKPSDVLRKTASVEDKREKFF